MSMARLCGWCGISRQAHQQQKTRDKMRAEREKQVVEMVQAVRQNHPKMGGRKLLDKLKKKMAEAGLAMGRDRFFDLLRRVGLLVRRRRRGPRTTWPGNWRCENLLPETTIKRPNQVWVCDITYIETEAGFGYLSLITDAHSRFVVGYDFSTSLAVEGAQAALAMAITRAGGAVAGVIHHSDRGIQYTCKAYRHDLAEHDMLCSMGQTGNCYDNALAERMNGILKQEYALGERFTDFQQASRAVDEAVWLYNYDRPHLSLDYQMPFQVHYQCDEDVLLEDFFCQRISGLDIEFAVCYGKPVETG